MTDSAAVERETNRLYNKFYGRRTFATGILAYSYKYPKREEFASRAAINVAQRQRERKKARKELVEVFLGKSKRHPPRQARFNPPPVKSIPIKEERFENLKKARAAKKRLTA